MTAAVPGLSASPSLSWSPVSSLCPANLPRTPPAAAPTTVAARSGGAARPTRKPTAPPHFAPVRPRWSPVRWTTTFPSGSWVTRIAASIRTGLVLARRPRAIEVAGGRVDVLVAGDEDVRHVVGHRVTPIPAPSDPRRSLPVLLREGARKPSAHDQTCARPRVISQCGAGADTPHTPDVVMRRIPPRRLDTGGYTPREYVERVPCCTRRGPRHPDPLRGAVPARRGDDLRLVRQPYRAVPAEDRWRGGGEREPRDRDRHGPLRPVGGWAERAGGGHQAAGYEVRAGALARGRGRDAARGPSRRLADGGATRS